LTDPKADDFEAMDTHDMLLLVNEIAAAHDKLERAELNSSFRLASVGDSAVMALDAIKNGAPLEVIEQCVHEILEAILED
jgi:hypothetical protein